MTAAKTLADSLIFASAPATLLRCKIVNCILPATAMAFIPCVRRTATGFAAAAPHALGVYVIIPKNVEKNRQRWNVAGANSAGLDLGTPNVEIARCRAAGS